MGRDSFRASTVVFAPTEDVFDFLADFTSYTEYTDYVDEIAQFGDGGVGTRYAITFRKRVLGIPLSYTARSRVVDLDPPDRIGWEIIKDLDAEGEWALEPADVAPGDRPAGVDPGDPATRVTIGVELARESIDESAVPTPLHKSVGWVVKKVYPFVIDEAKNVLRRIVADLEGSPRTPVIRFDEAEGLFTEIEQAFDAETDIRTA